MTVDQKLCCGIMICQMTAILSGVSILYLSVIVVIPSKEELKAGFNRNPIMCTTTRSHEILSKKEKCEWGTCGEWCLTGFGIPCKQISVLARSNGSAVKLTTCFDIENKTCSALDVKLTKPFKCKKGECKELTGLYNCTKEGENICREITPAFNCCSSCNLNPKTITCGPEKCEKRLGGVYSCKTGECIRLDHVRHYWRDCKRKCTDLKLRDINVVLFSKERLITTKCMSVSSNDNNTVSNLNQDQDWLKLKKVLFLYCTYHFKTHGVRGYDIHTGDCFNATTGLASKLVNITNFLDVLAYTRELYNNSEWLIEPENSLTIMNETQLRINPEGCVNSLRKECKAFFKTHARDGSDGMSQDRYPCYYSDQKSEYVIGKYNPDLTYMYLMVATVLPATLFITSCTCLFICSKSVGIDDDGRLKLMLMKRNSNIGNMTKK